MIDNMSTLHSNQTWELVSLPLGKTIIRWVYTVKIMPNGRIDHLKARLVAKECFQIFCFNYGDTFSLVVKMESIHLFLARAFTHHWILHQLDIKNSFLHRELQVEVYMEQPP